MDWSKSVSRRLRLLGKAGPRRCGSALRIMAWLLLADLALRLLPFPRAESLLRGRPRRGARPLSGAEIRALAREVEAAARYHLYPIHCLRRALVLRRLLDQRGLATELRFGVRKEGEEIRAHAWLEHAGESLDPNPSPQGYARLEEPGEGARARRSTQG